MRIVLILSYLGTAYSGWQIQPSRDTVEGQLLKALQRFTTEQLKLYVAGRTDAGVHATSQVVHFDTDKDRPWIRANDFLPGDIRILQVRKVDITFHARYLASSREYVYVMELGKVANPLNYKRVLHVPEVLNISSMRDAAMPLVGTADFSAWRCSGCVSRNTIKTIEYIKIEEMDQYIVTKIKADAFLYRMVRNIVGTLYLAGQGLLSQDQVLQMRKDLGLPGIDIKLVPAHGLYFVGASYNSFPDITALCYNGPKHFYAL